MAVEQTTESVVSEKLGRELTIEEKLNILKAAREDRDGHAQHFDEKIAELKKQRDAECEGLDKEIAEWEESIKVDVLAKGETVKGASLMAMFVKGRTSWDSKKLDGYAAAHPEILEFKKTGNPTVQIKPVK